MFNKQHPISNTIKQQVYQIIKDQICKGVYSPGKWLQEKELANEFKVSRSPVREALRQLASDGLVEEVPHKGVFVKRLTPKDIQDIFDVRLLLESYAIDRIPQYLNEENRADLKACLDDLINAYNNNDLDLYIEHDTRLHNMLIDMSGNNLIISTYEKVQTMILQFRVYSLTTKQRFDESVNEHTSIVNFILKGNTKEANKVNKIHLELAKEKIQDYIKTLDTVNIDTVES